MKSVFDPQLQKYHNRTEYGDVIKVIVDDETAERIKKEDAERLQAQIAESEASAIDPTYTLQEGLKAPREWHEKNFVLGKDILWPKEINATRFVEDPVTGDVEETKTPVGYRGAVADYIRVKPTPEIPKGVEFTDDYSFFDWQVDEGYLKVKEEYDFNDPNKNLLDFYVLPSPSKEQTEIPYVENEDYEFGPEYDDDVILPFKPSSQEKWGIAEHRDYLAKVALRMKNDNKTYEQIKTFIEEGKVARNCG